MHLSYHDRVQEVERLAHELNDLLASNPSLRRQRKMHRKARSLVHWVDAYQDGLRYGAQIDGQPAAEGNAWLTGVSDRFKLEGEMRVNSESPAEEEADQGQAETEDFIRSAKHVINSTSQDTAGPETRKGEGASVSVEDAMQQTCVKDIMQPNPVIISPDESLQEAARKMESVRCGMLPVGTADKVEGIITDRDIVLRAVAKGKDINTERVRNHMTTEIWSVQEGDAVYRAADMMREKKVNRLLVRDEKGQPRGILTFGRLLRQNDSMQEIAIMIECAVGEKKG